MAVRGPSGCGKSTLLMIVGALGSPTSGSVTVGERRPVGDVRCRPGEIPRHADRLRLPDVPPAALPDRPGKRRRRRLSGQQAAAKARAGELLEQFHLADRAGHRPAELSAGERQRVAIARAMVNRPELILADEPTGNLDSESARDVLDLLAEFHRREGTLLLVTHDEQAASYAERTLRMRGGSFVGG